MFNVDPFDLFVGLATILPTQSARDALIAWLECLVDLGSENGDETSLER
jgi:hypothetical protein